MRQKIIITMLLQSLTDVYYKVRQVLQSVTDCYYKVHQVNVWQAVITKCDNFYKVRRNSQGFTSNLTDIISAWK